MSDNTPPSQLHNLVKLSRLLRGVDGKTNADGKDNHISNVSTLLYNNYGIVQWEILYRNLTKEIDNGQLVFTTGTNALAIDGFDDEVLNTLGLSGNSELFKNILSRLQDMHPDVFSDIVKHYYLSNVINADNTNSLSSLITFIPDGEITFYSLLWYFSVMYMNGGDVAEYFSGLDDHSNEEYPLGFVNIIEDNNYGNLISEGITFEEFLCNIGVTKFRDRYDCSRIYELLNYVKALNGEYFKNKPYNMCGNQSGSGHLPAKMLVSSGEIGISDGSSMGLNNNYEEYARSIIEGFIVCPNNGVRELVSKLEELLKDYNRLKADDVKDVFKLLYDHLLPIIDRFIAPEIKKDLNNEVLDGESVLFSENKYLPGKTLFKICRVPYLPVEMIFRSGSSKILDLYMIPTAFIETHNYISDISNSRFINSPSSIAILYVDREAAKEKFNSHVEDNIFHIASFVSNEISTKILLEDSSKAGEKQAKSVLQHETKNLIEQILVTDNKTWFIKENDLKNIYEDYEGGVGHSHLPDGTLVLLESDKYNDLCKYIRYWLVDDIKILPYYNELNEGRIASTEELYLACRKYAITVLEGIGLSSIPNTASYAAKRLYYSKLMNLVKNNWNVAVEKECEIDMIASFINKGKYGRRGGKEWAGVINTLCKLFIIMTREELQHCDIFTKVKLNYKYSVNDGVYHINIRKTSKESTVKELTESMKQEKINNIIGCMEDGGMPPLLSKDMLERALDAYIEARKTMFSTSSGSGEKNMRMVMQSIDPSSTVKSMWQDDHVYSLSILAKLGEL